MHTGGMRRASRADAPMHTASFKLVYVIVQLHKASLQTDMRNISGMVGVFRVRLEYLTESERPL